MNELLGSEPAAVRGDQPKPRVVSAMLIEPSQQLGEAQLAKGCGPEPQDDLAVVNVMGEGASRVSKSVALFPVQKRERNRLSWRSVIPRGTGPV